MASITAMLWIVSLGFAAIALVIMFILWRRNAFINSGQEEGE